MIIEKQGITPQEFEEQTGLPKTLLRTLSNKDTVRLDSLRRICGGLGIKLAEVFREGEDVYELDDAQREDLLLFSSLFPEQQEYVLEYAEYVITVAERN